MTETLIVIAVCLIIVFLIGYIVIIKAQMRKARREIQLNKDTYYNRQIMIELIDRDLNNLVSCFNDNLEYQKKLKFEAEQSENRLKQSISDIAHDLRTPITVVRGNLQMMAKSGDLSEEDRTHLNICMDKIAVLSIMVDEFYEMSYYESEDVDVCFENVDANEFLASFLIENESLIREKKIEPIVDMPDYSVFAYADKNMLQRMLSNLLTNAIRHGGRNLQLRLREDRQKVIFEFENETENADSINISHIFDRTYRGDKARTGGGPGGLGLYIVKLLATKQGADVFADIKDNKINIGIELKKCSK